MKTAAADQGRIIKMQADMSMIVSESVSQGSLGVGISILIAWLRSKDWFSNRFTLPLSYFAAAATTFGVHFIADGDFFTTGTDITIHIPNAQHILESMVMFTSNLTGQKGYALLNKLTAVSAALTTLQQGPTVTTQEPMGRTLSGKAIVVSESTPTAAAEAKPWV